MTQVIADISVSLDGYVAGPKDGPRELPMGEGGQRLHRWMFELESWRAQAGGGGGEAGAASDLMAEYFRRSGAILMGRRMFDHGEQAWGDEPPFRVPVFVVTHRARSAEVEGAGTSWHFVLDGVASAVKQARAAADGRDVAVMGGGQVISACLAAGLLDELRVHLVPVLLGGGVPLFGETMDPRVGLEQSRVEASSGVTHLFYRVHRSGA